jgi:hypothetical protein
MRKLIALLSAIVVVTASGTCAVHIAKPSRTAKPPVPAIARILGVTVGQTTIERLEKKLGPGAPCMGGHPHGGRAWYLKPCRIWVYADGFEYDKKGGRIIDDIQLGISKQKMRYSFTQETKKRSIPRVSARCKDAGWLGQVLPGMSRADVVKATVELPKPKAKGGKLMWSSGEWSAELTSEKDKLVVLEVTGPGL